LQYGYEEKENQEMDKTFHSGVSAKVVKVLLEVSVMTIFPYFPRLHFFGLAVFEALSGCPDSDSFTGEMSGCQSCSMCNGANEPAGK
jgi:hypothetical protein